ncbi:MAG: hypothetical protein ACI4LO_03200 [Anaerovoracaceae bacterium]
MYKNILDLWKDINPFIKGLLFTALIPFIIFSYEAGYLEYFGLHKNIITFNVYHLLYNVETLYFLMSFVCTICILLFFIILFTKYLINFIVKIRKDYYMILSTFLSISFVFFTMLSFFSIAIGFLCKLSWFLCMFFFLIFFLSLSFAIPIITIHLLQKHDFLPKKNLTEILLKDVLSYSLKFPFPKVTAPIVVSYYKISLNKTMIMLCFICLILISSFIFYIIPYFIGNYTAENQLTFTKIVETTINESSININVSPNAQDIQLIVLKDSDYFYTITASPKNLEDDTSKEYVFSPEIKIVSIENTTIKETTLEALEKQ